MKIDLDSLRVLDAIDRNRTFAAAAQELNRVPSAVTYAVNQLELDLGVCLFDRSGYRAKFTPTGKELLEGGRLVLEQALLLEKKVKIAAGVSVPNLTFSYDDAIGFEALTGILDLFLNMHPETSLTLKAEILNGSRESLVSGCSDLVVGWFSQLPTESVYGYEFLGQISFVFALSPHHPLAQVHTPLTHENISAYPMIVVPDSSKNMSKASSGYAPENQMVSVPSMDAKIKAQVAGLGVGFVPLSAATAYLEAGLLIAKEVERPKINGRCYMAWRQDKMNPVLKSLMDLLRKHKKDLFGGSS
jgi:DNA-binding transcriptional LysR family regulator